MQITGQLFAALIDGEPVLTHTGGDIVGITQSFMDNPNPDFVTINGDWITIKGGWKLQIVERRQDDSVLAQVIERP